VPPAADLGQPAPPTPLSLTTAQMPPDPTRPYKTRGSPLRPPADKANLWIFTPSRMLGHSTPAETIRDGHYRDGLDLIEAMADGVAV
jgi:hypothetical protein